MNEDFCNRFLQLIADIERWGAEHKVDVSGVVCSLDGAHEDMDDLTAEEDVR